MKYCNDPHAIYAKYEKCSDVEYNSILYLLYQFFTDLRRMSHYLTLEIPHPILHLLLQFLKTDAIYVEKHSKNVHIFPYLATLEPVVQRKLRVAEKNTEDIRMRPS